MSNFVWILFTVLILTLLGTTTLVLVTVKYYWAARGTPPPTREERQELKKEELRLRAKQIEYAKTHPITTRKPDFFDNTKAYQNKDPKQTKNSS